MEQSNVLQNDEYDSPWKDVLEKYFYDFMNMFFPNAAIEIDWKKGYTFLDKELQQVVRDAGLGKRLADKLVRIDKKNGEELWLLTHIEIQGKRETEFAKRMYVYNYRIFDRYDRPVVSMAVLTDNHTNWRPDSYIYKLWGCETGIKFPVVKLIDFKDKWNELENSQNPFAIIVMTHLKNLDTRNDLKNRKKWKLYFIKQLYQKGYEREDIINLFAFIDWVMRLPKEMEQDIWKEVQNYEEEKNMPYITSVEKIGIEKGLIQGFEKGLLRFK